MPCAGHWQGDRGRRRSRRPGSGIRARLVALASPRSADMPRRPPRAAAARIGVSDHGWCLRRDDLGWSGVRVRCRAPGLRRCCPSLNRPPCPPTVPPLSALPLSALSRPCPYCPRCERNLRPRATYGPGPPGAQSGADAGGLGLLDGRADPGQRRPGRRAHRLISAAAAFGVDSVEDGPLLACRPSTREGMNICGQEGVPAADGGNVTQQCGARNLFEIICWIIRRIFEIIGRII